MVMLMRVGFGVVPRKVVLMLVVGVVHVGVSMRSALMSVLMNLLLQQVQRDANRKCAAKIDGRMRMIRM